MAKRAKKEKLIKTNNLIVISDTHCGCQLGLHPNEPTELDDGGIYEPSELQIKVWNMWREFWDEWVPKVTHGEPFSVVLNGDAMDGRHHRSTHQISQNLTTQKKIAKRVLSPVVEACEGRFYLVRGSEVHSGPSSEEEEALGESLNAIPDKTGRHARWELWARVGRGLCHVMHHIGTTGSSHYESSAPLKELTEAYGEAGRWHREPPDVVARAHRHRHIEVRVPTNDGYGIVFCTASWQLKTPFSYRTAGGRVTTPQIGGSLIRQGDEDLYTRHRHWDIGRSEEVVV